jgi:hypothetical protein
MAVGAAAWASLGAYLGLMKWMLHYFSPKSYEFEASFPAYVKSPEVQAWGPAWYETLKPIWAEKWLIVPAWWALGAVGIAIAVSRIATARRAQSNWSSERTRGS